MSGRLGPSSVAVLRRVDEPSLPKTNLRQPPATAPDVQPQAEVTQHLKLLADFVADVADLPRVVCGVIGMEFFQFAGEDVGVGSRKNVGGRSSTTPHFP